MLSTLNNIGKGQAELTVELSLEELEPYLKKAATNISQATKIPGFRQGNAPYEIVKNHVGEMTIYEEASHLAIRKTLFETIKEKDLNIVSEPNIDIVKLAPGNPLIYKATINLLPSVKVGNIEKVKVTNKAVKLDDNEIEKVLKNFQEIFAAETLSENPAKLGDRVEIDFEVSLDKVVIDGGNQKKYPLVIGNKQMLPGFEEQLIGLKKDEEKTFQLKFPDDYQNKMVAGKKADFKVKMINVYERKLPDINDELVQKIGQYKNLEELKQKIREDLLKDKENKENKRLEQEMLEQLIKLSEFGEIPEILVNNEIEKMIEEFRQGIKANGIDFNQYLQNIKKTTDNLKLDFSGQALTRIKASLLIQTVANEKNITFSEEEVNQEVNHLIGEHQLTGEQKERINSIEYRHYLENALRQQKALEELKKELIS